MANVDVTRIAGNIGALNALYSLQHVNSALATHQERLATGKRLMQAADDPAGMSIATTFDIRRQSIKTVLNTIGDSKNLLSNMETGLKKIQDILVKMQNKTMEAKGDTIGTNERNAIKTQLDAYQKEIDDIVQQTQWNGNNLISGSGGTGASTTLNFLTNADPTLTGTSTFAFAAGTYISANQGFQANAGTAATASNAGLGLQTTNLNVSNVSVAASTAKYIDFALGMVKEGIAQVGAFNARLTFKEETLMVQHANTEAAYNRIMNANMAEEQVEASKLLILQQSATAMLAQANSSPQFILQLFR